MLETIARGEAWNLLRQARETSSSSNGGANLARGQQSGPLRQMSLYMFVIVPAGMPWFQSALCCGLIQPNFFASMRRDAEVL
eukprot:8174706-Pyramimonas_sp.AAC.1